MATSSRALLIAFFAVVAGFIGSTIWAQSAARTIDSESVYISRDAAPGIATLSALRAELRALESGVATAVEERDDGAVAVARAQIDRLMAQALALPNTPFELDRLGQLQKELRRVDEAAERALAQVHSGRTGEARITLQREVRPLGNAAGAVANEIVDYNARMSRAAAERIEEARQNANRLAFQLDALCAVLAIAAAWIVLRVVRQVARVQQEQKQLVERKAEELEQFAGRVAHDILSPLSAVGIALSIAGRQGADAATALKRGNSSLLRVRGIVDGLLEFARAGARAEPGAHTDVHPVIAGLEEELTPFAANRGATLHVEPAPDCAVPCSPGVLLSVLGNLLRNALKYLGNSAEREVWLRVRLRRGKVLFEVEDTGPGIPAELTSRIFEPYVRGPDVNAPGIGLGLATVKRLAESHGGVVGVRPGSRGGALFWVELPEAPARPPARPSLESQDASLS